MTRIPTGRLASVALFVFAAITLGAAHLIAVSASTQTQDDRIATIALRVEGMT